MTIFRMRQAFLIFTGVGLAVIGLGYGINPSFYPDLYGYRLTTINEIHIFRALCTLYLTLAGYWIYVALQKPHWHEATKHNHNDTSPTHASGLTKLRTKKDSETTDATNHPNICWEKNRCASTLA